MGLFYGLKTCRLALLLFLLLGAVIITGCGEKNDMSGESKVETEVDQGKLHFDAGISNLYEKNYDTAIEEFEKSLKINPHSASTLNNIGFAYFDQGNVEKALEYQARALEADSEFSNAYYGLALAFEVKGNTDAALKNWNQFLSRVEPESKWALKAQEHIKKLEKGSE